ncbi:MAG: transposase [Patescibacteria group bacterium]
MGYRRVPFACEEWYHCYSRGIDKRVVFEDDADAQRFVELLYLANDNKPIQRENFYHLKHSDILRMPRNHQIVSIGAYSLMKNHYHLLIQEIEEGGITKFMQKVGTGYSMYFNKRHNRVGNVFVKPFRSKHVSTDRYLYRVAQYIHLNAAEIFEKGWKHGRVSNIAALQQKLTQYPFSSFPDYASDSLRPERSILDESARTILADRLPELSAVLIEMRDYYLDLEREFKSKR